jgi:hypothetical protein
MATKSGDVHTIKVFFIIRLVHNPFQYFELFDGKQLLLQKNNKPPLKWLREIKIILNKSS